MKFILLGLVISKKLVEKTLHEPIDVNKLDSKSDARLQGNLGHHLSILLAEDNLTNQMVTQRMPIN